MLNIPSNFVLDQQNYVGLDTMVSNFAIARKELEMAYQLHNRQIVKSVDALIIYGLLHRRYIETSMGETVLKNAVLAGNYGECLRNGCNQVKLIPCGLDQAPGHRPLCTYCVTCQQYYVFQGDDAVDGAFFGPTIVQKLTTDTAFVQRLQAQTTEHDRKYECGKTLFGFEIAYDKLKKT